MSEQGEPKPHQERDAGSVFTGQCVRWARERASLRTDLLPNAELAPDPADSSVRRFSGRWSASEAASTWGYVAFVVLCAGWILWASADGFLADLGPAAQQGLAWAGVVSMIAGGLGVPVAWLVLGRQGVPVEAIVECDSGPVSVEALQAWQGPASTRGREVDPSRRVWVFAKGGFQPAATAFAVTMGIRCLAPSGGAFEDVTARTVGLDPGGSVPTTTRVLKRRGSGPA